MTFSTKSERSQADAQTPLGVATHDVAGRVLASLGQGGPVASRFEPCADVPKAGVLLALPALLAGKPAVSDGRAAVAFGTKSDWVKP